MTREMLMPTAPAQDLAFALADLHLPSPLVVALPEGMSTACRIARALGAPFDVLVSTDEQAAAGAASQAPPRSASLLKGRSVVLADDGDTGIAAWAQALQALRSMRPDVLVVAAPRLQPSVARWLASAFECDAGTAPAGQALCCATT